MTGTTAAAQSRPAAGGDPASPDGHADGVPSSNVFPLRRPAARSRCEHCEALVERVWLVPGDVLDSCANCWQAVMGSPPQPEHGHSRPVEEPVRRAVASFYLRADGRRPA